MNSDFKHTHHAHCESGVMSSILRHHGLNISEPMIFGLSNALSFAYIPFIKLGGMPLVAYRSMPKSIIKNIQKNLQIEMKLETFSSKEKGASRLDELHFNAHNLLIYARDGEDYLISDPVFDHSVKCDKESLIKARFAKGVMAPKGLLYYPISVPRTIDLKPIVKKNIHKVAKSMLNIPIPIAGLRGIRYLAKTIIKLEHKERKYAKLFLGNIVRMQEEIGTGGAGFRFMYASFLQEASELFNDDVILKEASKLMLEVGDKWRDFALMIAKSIKSKNKIDFQTIADKLFSIADDESKVYRKMLEFKV